MKAKVKNEKYAKQVCWGIAVFGLIVFALFNQNFHLLFSGDAYVGEVIKVRKEHNKCFEIEIEFTRINGMFANETIFDCTGETFLFLIEEGDMLKLWESKHRPYQHYVPFVNFAVKVVLLVFFVFVPLLFAFLGRY
jgi:hypothetical protein